MSSEGVTLVMRAGLMGAAIIMVATVRVLVPGNPFEAKPSQGRTRGRIMLAGTLGGLSVGLLLAYPISQRLKTDVSVICGYIGVALGWAVAWSFAKRIPVRPATLDSYPPRRRGVAHGHPRAREGTDRARSDT
jgi:hypothetical protein